MIKQLALVRAALLPGMLLVGLAANTSCADVFVASGDGVKRLDYRRGSVRETIGEGLNSTLVAYDWNGTLYFQASSTDVGIGIYRHDLISGETDLFLPDTYGIDMAVGPNGRLHLLGDSGSLTILDRDGTLLNTIRTQDAGRPILSIGFDFQGHLVGAGSHVEDDGSVLHYFRTASPEVLADSSDLRDLDTNGTPIVPSVNYHPNGSLYSHDYDEQSHRHFVRAVDGAEQSPEYDLTGVYFGTTFAPDGNLVYSEPVTGRVINVDALTQERTILASGILFPMDISVFPIPAGSQAATTIADDDIDRDGELNVNDINRLSGLLRNGLAARVYDFDGSGSVNESDIDRYLHSTFRTKPGDANLDGVFDSRDLVAAWKHGHYETSQGTFAGWESGDWNYDGLFTSTDLTTAFSSNTYQGPRPVAVPESSSLRWLVFFPLAALVVRGGLLR